MKYAILLFLLSLMLACNQADKKAKEAGPNIITDTTPVVKKPDMIPARPPSPAIIYKEDSVHLSVADSALLRLSRQILTAIKTKDFTKLASFVSPKYGVRFSPYAFIDSSENLLVYPKQLISLSWQQKIRKWGSDDGTEAPLLFNLPGYFDRYVYPKDFLHAKVQSVNQSHGGGNSLNNLKTFYPNADFTEFYFPGFDPKYDGMDFRLLRLVFKKEKNKIWLIAIVHDEWTI
jgi:hypothetical protein